MSVMSALYEMSGFWFKRNERRSRKTKVTARNGVHSVECPALRAAIQHGPGTVCPCLRCSFGLQRPLVDVHKETEQ
jgi:hypothetical protein